MTPAPLSQSHRLSGTREQYATRAAFLITGLSMSSWAPLVPFAKARLTIEDGTLGLLLLCLGLGSIIAMPVTGILTNRFGCRLVISIATLVVSCAIPALALTQTLGSLAVVIAVFGACVGTLSVAINVQAVIVENESSRHMMSGFHGLFSVGGFLGSGTISLLINAGLAPEAATFVLSAAILVSLLLAWSGLLPYGNQNAGQTPLFVLPKGFIIFLGSLCFLVFLTEGAMLDWSAVLLTSIHKLNPAQAGFGYSAFAVAMTVGRLSGDWLVRTIKGTQLISLGALLGAIGLLFAVFAPSPSLAFVGFVLIGLGVSNLVPVIFRAAGRQTRMPPSLAIASITTMGYSGILLGPAVIGFLAQRFSLELSFSVIAVGLIFVAASGSKVR